MDKPPRQAGDLDSDSRFVQASADRDALRDNAQNQDAANVVVFPAPPLQLQRENDVERVNQFPLYDLGKVLRTLTVHVGDIKADIAIFELLNASSAVAELLAGRPMPLGISRAAAEALRDSISQIWTRHFQGPVKEDGTRAFRFPEDTDAPIEGWEWNAIRMALSTFETVFAAEMTEMTTYFVPRRGIYSTPALADKADESFPDELQAFVPAKTKADWQSAGRCMAFNLLSACGFHVARAVEGTMESYYQLFSGKPGKTLRSWDDYHKELEKIAAANPSPAPEPKTLVEFDQMRQDYRNPIVHPRVTLTEADARILFNNGESLIIAMASELRRAQISQGGVQPNLNLVSGGSPPG